jgi:predicted MFS family arabinose efflux permease
VRLIGARLEQFEAGAARRGFILLALMQIAFGFALTAQQNIATNYFNDVLGFKGPEFGYITAIREVPGFLLIFLSAIFYRVTLQRLTAGALLLLGVAYMLFGVSFNFWTVAPWVILSSMGYHTVLQTQNALALTLTTERRSGSILGWMGGANQAGSLFGIVFILITFAAGVLSFRSAFVALGIAAILAAVAVVRFPHLHDGREQTFAAKRDPIVFKKEYRLYYLLSIIDGARQQIFFSFGLYVLVAIYHLSVEQVSALLIVVTLAATVFGPAIGRAIDTQGERRMLGWVNVAYIVALAGYAFTTNLAVAAACYVIYTFIFPLSTMGASTYLRKIAEPADLAPSFAMGTTMQHAAAIVVPLSTGFILNFVGYQVPFAIACGFAFVNIFVVQKLDPANQRSAGRRALDEETALANALEVESVEIAGDAEPGSRLSSTAAAVAIADQRPKGSDE